MIDNAKDKRTNNDLQNTAQKTEDRVARTPQNIDYELRCSGRVRSSCSTFGTLVTLVTNVRYSVTVNQFILSIAKLS